MEDGTNVGTICRECNEYIESDMIEIICPDCTSVLHERCTQEADGEMCCPACADERLIV